MSLRDKIHPSWGRFASWALVALIVTARLANFWGLHYGNTDDIIVDFSRMTLPLWTLVDEYAAGQSRVQTFVIAPLWAAMMRLAGTPWYDLINLGSFALGALAPPFALRRYYFPGNTYLLYAAAFFAPFPFLFSYVPPYSHPLHRAYPLIACAVAVILFDQSQRDGRELSGIRSRLAAGTVATFLAVCNYESTAVVSVVFLGFYFAASNSGRPWKTLLERSDFRWAAAAMGCFVSLYMAYRAGHPPGYEGVLPSASHFSLSSASRVVGTLSLTSSVFTWFIAPQRSLDLAPIYARLSLDHVTIAEIGLALLTAAAVFVWIIRPGAARPQSSPLKLAVLSILLLFGPNAFTPSSPRSPDPY